MSSSSAAAGVPPGVHSVWIINKSGGLVFQKNYADVPTIDTNETLRLASIWHSLHTISVQLSPVEGCTGIELLETEHLQHVHRQPVPNAIAVQRTERRIASVHLAPAFDNLHDAPGCRMERGPWGQARERPEGDCGE